MTYDDVGNLEYMEDCQEEGLSDAYLYTYGYDDLYRLNFLKIVEANTQDQEQTTYDYDDNGNLEEIRGSSINVSSSNNQITDSGYDYDANGNMTTHKGNTVTYDWRDMLIGYGNNTYVYDAYGERVRKNTRELPEGGEAEELHDRYSTGAKISPYYITKH